MTFNNHQSSSALRQERSILDSWDQTAKEQTPCQIVTAKLAHTLRISSLWGFHAPFFRIWTGTSDRSRSTILLPSALVTWQVTGFVPAGFEIGFRTSIFPTSYETIVPKPVMWYMIPCCTSRFCLDNRGVIFFETHDSDSTSEISYDQLANTGVVHLMGDCRLPIAIIGLICMSWVMSHNMSHNTTCQDQCHQHMTHVTCLFSCQQLVVFRIRFSPVSSCCMRNDSLHSQGTAVALFWLAWEKYGTATRSASAWRRQMTLCKVAEFTEYGQSNGAGLVSSQAACFSKIWMLMPEAEEKPFRYPWFRPGGLSSSAVQASPGTALLQVQGSNTGHSVPGFQFGSCHMSIMSEIFFACPYVSKENKVSNAMSERTWIQTRNIELFPYNLQFTNLQSLFEIYLRVTYFSIDEPAFRIPNPWYW